MKLKYDYKKRLLKVKMPENPRFKDDVITYENDRVTIYSCGFFLNIKECMEANGCLNIEQMLLKLFDESKLVLTVLKGCYIVAILDKLTGRFYVYNDLLSKHSVFYHYDEKSKTLLLSDSFFEVVSMMKAQCLPYTIDQLGVKMMMWHRMFYDDVTYIREIKFLRPFDYLVVENEKLELKRIPREEMIGDISMEAAAGEMHKLFSKAVKLQYSKNQEYGYPQITTISGGMDSRSTFLYGLASGYTDQIGFCYGESSSKDFDCALQLTNKNNCQFFFHPIDNGNHLLERDEMCNANEAQAVYSGPSGTYDSLKFYNTSGWGIVHTGLGGGEILGDMRVDENPSGLDRVIEQLKYRLGKGKKDRTWESFVSSLRCTDEERKRLETFYKDYNDFNEFQSLCDMRRCLNSQKMGQAFGVEYVSPFLYEEFFCYMLRIPYSLTKGRQLYLYWQKKYNPRQFETPSTFQMGCRPRNKAGYYIKRIYKYAVNRMGRKTKWDMNPAEHWMVTNLIISQSQQEWFDDDMRGIRSDSYLYRILRDSWSDKSMRDSILTVTWTLNKIQSI